MLWKKLKADDFDTDIIEVLRESNKKIREQLEGLSRDDFSEVFLFFDYDAHQTNLGKSDDVDVINQMLESFDNETENGVIRWLKHCEILKQVNAEMEISAL